MSPTLLQALLVLARLGLAQGAAPQGVAPELEAAVDRRQAGVGDELIYRLRAVARSAAAVRLTVAPFTGFEVVSRVERTELSYAGGAPRRTTVLAVRLRAAQPGRWPLGPAHASAGGQVVEAAAIVVDIAPDRAPGTVALSPRVGRMLERAPTPPPGQASVALLISSDSARVGEQVDVVTAAWFPRDLRLQLRRPPTLQPPVIGRVWSYPQATPAGIAATRIVAGQTYDLFVAHQIVFPLLPGPVTIEPATLKFSTPQALQFFSQEERFILSSGGATLEVGPLPDAGRPADFAGAVGTGLRLTRRISPARGRAGEPVTVELALSGAGNLALWPGPEPDWPPGARAYADRVEEQVRTSAGLIGGTKMFRYLVVPDSAGVLRVPAVRYPYFDLTTGRYATAQLPGVSLPIAPATRLASAGLGSAALDPLLLAGDSPSFAWRVAHGPPQWVWIALVLAAPVLPLLLRSRPPHRPASPAATPASDLRGAEERLDALLATLAPDPALRSGPALAAAVRARGGDAAFAARAVEIRERLLALRYGPETVAGTDQALAAEVEQMVRRLGTRQRRRGPRHSLGTLGVAALLSLPGPGQSPPPPDRLDDTGALRAAAADFAERAARNPPVAAHWYNLGSAYYRLGERGRAAAAWLRAGRLAPRNPAVHRALRLVPAPDPTSGWKRWAAPVTPEELGLAGGILWLLGWGAWWAYPRARRRLTVFIVVAGGALVAAPSLAVWYRRPVAVLLAESTLRLSPHGRAPAVGVLQTGSAVVVSRSERSWVLVRAAGGRDGWLPDAVVALIGS